MKTLRDLINQKQYRVVYRKIKPLVQEVTESRAEITENLPTWLFLARFFCSAGTEQERARTRAINRALNSLIEENFGADSRKEHGAPLNQQYKILIRCQLEKLLPPAFNQVRLALSEEKKPTILELYASLATLDLTLVIQQLPRGIYSLVTSENPSTEIREKFFQFAEELLDLLPGHAIEVFITFIRLMARPPFPTSYQPQECLLLLRRVEKFVHLYPELCLDGIPAFLQLCRHPWPDFQVRGINYLRLMEKNMPGCLRPVILPLLSLPPSTQPEARGNLLILLKDVFAHLKGRPSKMFSEWRNTAYIGPLERLTRLEWAGIVDFGIEFLLRSLEQVFFFPQPSRPSPSRAVLREIGGYLRGLASEMHHTFFSVLSIKQFLEKLLGRPIAVELPAASSALDVALARVLDAFMEQVHRELENERACKS